MARPNNSIVTGYALHYFDAGRGQRGSDKFYRAFIYEDQGQWHAVMCWGRDGTSGQAKLEHCTTQHDAQKLIDKKQAEKVRHGYEVIGHGQATLPVRERDLTLLGVEFMHAIAERDPDKSRMSGGFLIYEEPDLMDLLG